MIVVTSLSPYMVGLQLTVFELQSVDLTSILQFRKALTSICDEFPFSPAFGSVTSRESCIECAQRVFERLKGGNSTANVLEFEILAMVAKTDDGEIDKSKTKELIRVFRPNRSGQLTKLEFLKSVDRYVLEL